MKWQALALSLILAGCGRSDDSAPAGGAPPAAQAPPSDPVVVDSTMALVARAAAVSLGVREAPGRADSVLEASGLTVEEFEALMYRIAADPGMSLLYEGAVGKR